MIRDTKGRKWFMRFRQYREGWHWEAYNHDGGCGISSDLELFPTRAAAEDDARRFIQGEDHIAYAKEYTRRLLVRGSECQLTAEDHEAIRAAGTL